MAEEEIVTGTSSDEEIKEDKTLDRLDKELATIRKRRTSGDGRRFPSGIEDYTLLAGITFGIFYFLILFAMSAGMADFLDDVDHSTSTTFLDPGGECTDNSGITWIGVWADNDARSIRIKVYNSPDGEEPQLTWNLTGNGVVDGAILNNSQTHIPFKNYDDGDYDLQINITFFTTEGEGENFTAVQQSSEESSVKFTIQTESGSWGWVPGVSAKETSSAELEDDGERNCWLASDLSNWAWILMGAELGGGRETAMLTGGAAGVPAWWMGFVSLSMSVITLMILYPIMYKVYHKDADDMLSHEQIRRLVWNRVYSSSNKLQIVIESEEYKMEERELSIDVLIPYQNTESTFSNSVDIRAVLLKDILEEFRIFGIFKPIQLEVRAIGEAQDMDFETGIGVGVDDMSERQLIEKGVGAGHVVEDYSGFFRDLHLLSRVEDDVQTSMESFFAKESSLELLGATVMSDELVVFVSLIYKPKIKLAFYRFKQKTIDIEKELSKYLEVDMSELLGERQLIVKARNQVETMADRSDAGRIETSGTNEDAKVAAVAKQDGLAGRVLQTKFIGDILSTVEYTANEKRDFINRWGFFGLIVFVWIPFMASGVLVGAMLGLLSRMNFSRVLWACFVGGSAASITWAYTAEGIVTVMHKYKLEAMIPIAIAAFVGMAILHIRTTKSRRTKELFESSLIDTLHADSTLESA